MSALRKNIDYKVIRKDHRYVMLKNYKHRWLRGETPVLDKGVTPPHRWRNVTFKKNEMILHKGYEWNGSNIVNDTKECMRASAVHDAWAEAMRRRIYRYSRKNWNRGAREYKAICIADGMRRSKASLRRWAIKNLGWPL